MPILSALKPQFANNANSSAICQIDFYINVNEDNPITRRIALQFHWIAVRAGPNKNVHIKFFNRDNHQSALHTTINCAAQKGYLTN